MGEQRILAARLRRQRAQRRASIRSTIVAAGVTAVLVASAATAWMLREADAGDPAFAVLEPVPPAQGSEYKQAAVNNDVVRAPPLRRIVPLLPDAGAGAQRPATSVMGASPGCPNCGTVETVVAVHEHGQAQARGYLMHIRMDDGSVRTVQHRGALAAGSRVAVEGSRLRPVVPSP